MGCGSSSLKGSSALSGTTANTQSELKPEPAKEIRHQFESIDYDSGATGPRRNTAYAPHETSRNPSVAAPSEHRPPSSRGGGPKALLPSNVAMTTPQTTQPTEGLAPPVQSHVPLIVPVQQPVEMPITQPQYLSPNTAADDKLEPQHTIAAPSITTASQIEHLTPSPSTFKP